jgi:prolyl oligopeptidase
MYHPIDYIDGCLAVRAYDRGGMGRIICVGDDVREVVPESREYMDSAATLGDKIASIYIDPDYYFEKIYFYDLKGNRLGIYVPEYPSSIYVYVDQAFSGELIVELTSFVQRYRVVRISSNLETMVIKESGVHKNFVVEHGYARSHDGTRIHYFIVRKKDSTQHRAILYGYGGFGIPFTTESLALQGGDGFISFQVFVFGRALWLLAVRER